MSITIDLENRNTIQIMRGIAIIMVVLHHSLSLLEATRAVDVTVHIIDMMHVNIFFVISGYLFQNSASKYRKIGFKNFLIKKIKELFVPYYTLSVLFALLIKFASKNNSVEIVLASKGYIAKTAYEIFLDPLIFRRPYFTSLWYIFVLLVYFVISWLFVNRKIKLYDLILIGAFGIGANMFLWRYMPDILYKTFRYYLFFMAGMWLFLQYGKRIEVKKRLWWASIGILILSIIRNIMIDLSGLTVLGRNIETQVERTLTAGAAVIICACVASRLAEKEKGQLLKKIGDKSYTIYLLHNPWVICVVAIIAQKIWCGSLIQLILIMGCGIGIPMIAYELILYTKEMLKNGRKNELP